MFSGVFSVLSKSIFIEIALYFSFFSKGNFSKFLEFSKISFKSLEIASLNIIFSLKILLKSCFSDNKNQIAISSELIIFFVEVIFLTFSVFNLLKAS
jgi:hypothetical protein